MSVLKELAAIAAKAAVEGALKGKDAIKEALSTSAMLAAGTATDETAKKLNLYRTNRWGEEVLKIPYFLTTDKKIENALSKHPERHQLVFHFENSWYSIKKGVLFYDPLGNVVFSIPADRKNLKHIILYQEGSLVGRIDKHFTINLNPLSDLQKYDILVRDYNKVVRVNWFKANVDGAAWTMKHKLGKDSVIEDINENEIARFYALGFNNFVFDYTDAIDPVELILSFMAVQMRTQESHNRQHHH